MKKPDNETIYLIPGNFDGSPCYLWSADPAPGEHDKPEEAVKFIRADIHEEVKAQLVAIQDSVVHGKSANAEPCATFCEAIATRKIFKQLLDENSKLRGWVKQLATKTPEARKFQAERDNAWRELREIREALKADPEESTADEVRAMAKHCETLHSLMVSGERRGEAKAKEALFPPFLLELSKSLNETPHCVRALNWNDEQKLQDWIKSLTAKGQN